MKAYRTKEILIELLHTTVGAKIHLVDYAEELRKEAMEELTEIEKYARIGYIVEYLAVAFNLEFNLMGEKVELKDLIEIYENRKVSK